jgi:ABC-type dipeptide/oligopeptide/nickel transport system ATPase component
MTPVLQVENLTTSFFTGAGEVKAVNGVSFAVERGEVLGIVGESGSGKSVTGFSIMGLVSPPGRVTGGRILFNGRNLVGLPEAEWRKLRGHRIAMVFQDPMTTLNPVLRIDTQMIEASKLTNASAAVRRMPVPVRRLRRLASRIRPRVSRPIPISSPGACASASPLRSRFCTALTFSSRMSRQRLWT